MIKIVFFDGNGVIYERPKDYAKEFFERLSNESSFKDVKEVFDLIKYDCALGKFNRVELFRKMLRIIGYDADPEELEKEYSKLRNNNISLINKIVPVLKDLKKRGIKIGLLSDGMYSSEEKGQWLRKMKVRRYFDYVFTSSDLGHTKIYPESTKKILKITNHAPNEILIVGHELKDFLGAMFIGAQTLSVGHKITTTYNVNDYSSIPEFLENEKLIQKKK